MLPIIHEAHERYYTQFASVTFTRVHLTVFFRYKAFAEANSAADIVEEEELERIVSDLNPPAIDKVFPCLTFI